MKTIILAIKESNINIKLNKDEKNLVSNIKNIT